jgi:hypothetical protein
LGTLETGGLRYHGNTARSDLERVESNEPGELRVAGDEIKEDNEDAERYEGHVQQLDHGKEREEGDGRERKRVKDVVAPLERIRQRQCIRKARHEAIERVSAIIFLHAQAAACACRHSLPLARR